MKAFKRFQTNRLLFAPWVAALAIVSSQAFAFDVRMAQSPTNTLALTTQAILSAKRSLLINIYDMRSQEIADAILKQVRAGVHVELLQEGEPVGGFPAAARAIQTEIAQAMLHSSGKSRYFEMVSPGKKSERRFKFNHAKYIVIDGKELLIGSENYSPGGQPVPGSVGSRGWEVLVSDLGITQKFATTFASDADPSQSDIHDVLTGSLRNSFTPTPNPLTCLSRMISGEVSIFDLCGPTFFERRLLQPQDQLPSIDHGNLSDSIPVAQASQIEQILSPTTSQSGLLALINSAKRTLDIEQATFENRWDKETESPLFRAVVSAARRGVKVRILMTDETLFYPPNAPATSKNRSTAKLFNYIAQQDRLPIQAQVADLRAESISHIHNKGVLVDGTKTLISSINWNRNSVTNNREAAVLITSREVHDHYARLFETDWQIASEANAATPGSGKFKQEVPALGIQMRREVYANCPETLEVVAAVGELNLSRSTDSSFNELSGARLDSHFVRSDSAVSCILTEVSQAEQSGRSRVLEIRERSSGQLTLNLEGYTRNGKLYSIRTTADATEEVGSGEIRNATVYDASGAAAQKLGKAVLQISR